YSLGVVFYEMLTGELPLGRFDPPSQRAAVDARLDEVVLRALARDPERRYQRVSDLKTDVDSITAQRPRDDTAVLPTSLPSRLPEADLKAVRRQLRGPATGLLLTALLACAPVLFYGLLLVAHLGEGRPFDVDLFLTQGALFMSPTV